MTQKSQMPPKSSTTTYAAHLHTEFTAAIRLHESLQGDDRRQAIAAVAEIQRLRERIHQEADRLGYAAACVTTIPDCKGECCKWHYPKNLDRFDFFISVVTLPPDRVTTALNRLADAASTDTQACPFLMPDGCTLSFQSRPILCANAYPCFMSDGFHAFLDIQRKEIDRQFGILKQIARRTAAFFQKGQFPNLKTFRKSIAAKGKPLSKTVSGSREEERY